MPTRARGLGRTGGISFVRATSVFLFAFLRVLRCHGAQSSRGPRLRLVQKKLYSSRDCTAYGVFFLSFLRPRAYFLSSFLSASSVAFRILFTTFSRAKLRKALVSDGGVGPSFDNQELLLRCLYFSATFFFVNVLRVLEYCDIVALARTSQNSIRNFIR